MRTGGIGTFELLRLASLCGHSGGHYLWTGVVAFPSCGFSTLRAALGWHARGVAHAAPCLLAALAASSPLTSVFPAPAPPGAKPRLQLADGTSKPLECAGVFRGKIGGEASDGSALEAATGELSCYVGDFVSAQSSLRGLASQVRPLRRPYPPWLLHVTSLVVRPRWAHEALRSTSKPTD
jgi:hypothetical protein